MIFAVAGSYDVDVNAVNLSQCKSVGPEALFVTGSAFAS